MTRVRCDAETLKISFVMIWKPRELLSARERCARPTCGSGKLGGRVGNSPLQTASGNQEECVYVCVTGLCVECVAEAVWSIYDHKHGSPLLCLGKENKSL